VTAYDWDWPDDTQANEDFARRLSEAIAEAERERSAAA
jgi:hypothetical protein